MFNYNKPQTAEALQRQLYYFKLQAAEILQAKVLNYIKLQAAEVLQVAVLNYIKLQVAELLISVDSSCVLSCFKLQSVGCWKIQVQWQQLSVVVTNIYMPYLSNNIYLYVYMYLSRLDQEVHQGRQLYHCEVIRGYRV